MPLLTGAVSSFFGFVFSIFAARVTMGMAAAAAFVATAGAAYAAVKLAAFAVSTSLTAVLPPAVVSAAGHFLPSNVSACLTAVLLVDAIMCTYDFWRQNLPIAFTLAKG